MICKKRNFGYSLVELLVAITVITIIAVTFFSLFNKVLTLIQIKRIQTTAAALATEQMEIIRNMSYTDLGTVGGIPVGTLSQTQSLTRSNIPFTVKTDVRYIDDAYDGVSPADLLPTDYKQVKLTIEWDTVWQDSSMFFLTHVAPKGIESSAGGGILQITVFDSAGVPVPQADVDIINTAESVSILNTKTNDNGLVIFPGAPPSAAGYEITADKPGTPLYSMARTYGVDDPVGNVTPSPLHLSVTTGNTTSASFAIDVVSTLTVVTNLDAPAGPLSLQFGLHGDKIVGYDGGDPPLGIYKYNNTHTTSSGSGAITINSLEWDNYTTTFDEATLGYNLISYSPPTNPLTLLANDTQTITFTFQQPYSAYTLLVSVKDENGSAFANVQVRVQRTLGGGYDQTIATGTTGQSFFSPLTDEDYDITLTQTGYDTVNVTITIVSNDEQQFTMFPTS